MNCRKGHEVGRNARGECLKCLADRQLAYRLRNSEKRSENYKLYHAENRDYLLASKRAYRALNADAISERIKVYRKASPHIANACSARRRARKAGAVPSWFGEFDRLAEAESHQLTSLREESTGFVWNVDHMIPLACETASGLHVASNFQVIPQSVNASKQNRMLFTEPLQWLSALTESHLEPCALPAP